MKTLTNSPEKKKLLIFGTSAIFVLCVAWIAFQFRDLYIPRGIERPPSSPRALATAEIQQALHEEYRFIHVEVFPDPENNSVNVVNGEVLTKLDLEDLKKRVVELSGQTEVRFEVHASK